MKTKKKMEKFQNLPQFERTKKILESWMFRCNPYPISPGKRETIEQRERREDYGEIARLGRETLELYANEPWYNMSIGFNGMIEAGEALTDRINIIFPIAFNNLITRVVDDANQKRLELKSLGSEDYKKLPYYPSSNLEDWIDGVIQEIVKENQRFNPVSKLMSMDVGINTIMKRRITYQLIGEYKPKDDSKIDPDTKPVDPFGVFTGCIYSDPGPIGHAC